MAIKGLMAKTPEKVQAFEERLANRILSQAHKQLQKLADLKRNITGNETDVLASWDIAFYANK